VLFTLANVWLVVKEHIWTWPFGIVSVLLYLLVFWRSHLFLNAGLQVVYLVLSIHGWYEWLHGGEQRSELRVRRATPRTWLAPITGGIAATALLLGLLRVVGTSESLPLWDAITTAFSLAGQWMLNTKVVENWFVWAAVDVIYVVMFIHQKLYLTAGLYALFIVLCVKGFLDWRRSAASSAATR
jgi:nicotinamide mononucleotide transporter